MPVGGRKQRVRPPRVRRQEVAIGFVEDQPYAACAAQVEKLGEQFRRIDGAGRIVGADDRKGADVRRDGFGDVRR